MARAPMARAWMVMALLVAASPALLAAAPAPRADKPAPKAERTAPTSQAPDRAALEAYRRLCEASGADACLVTHRGRVVLEWTGPRYREQGFAYMMSSTKSVTALLVGMLVEDGRIKSIDEPVGHYLPEWKEGPRAAVTIRHLLAHTSGLTIGHDPKRSVGSVQDKYAYVRALVPEHPPGVRFSYSNEGVQLLAPIMEAAAGEPLDDYARRRLFAPLGLTRTRFHVYPAGQAWTHADMESTPREFARFGELMASGGVWAGKRLVSRWWVDQLTTPAQPFEPSCGLLWWRDAETGGFGAHGFRATNMHVIPAKDLVVVRTQGRPGPMGEALYDAQARPLLRRLAGLAAVPADAIAVALAEALEAYRTKRLPEVVAASERALALRGLTARDRAEAHLFAAMASQKLGGLEAARRHYAAYRADAAALPADHWALAWAQWLETELTPPVAPKAPTTAPKTPTTAP